MFINSVSFGNAASGSIVTGKQPSIESKKVYNLTKEQKEKLNKALLYIAGAAVLAVSAFAFRNKIVKILKKAPKPVNIPQPENIKPENIKPESQAAKIPTQNLPAVIYKFDFNTKKYTPKFIPTPKITPKIKGEPEYKFKIPEFETNEKNIKHEVKISTETNTLKESFKEICIGFDKNGLPIYEKIEMPIKFGNTSDAFKEAFENSKINDKEIVDKIVNIRKSELKNIDRIINENTHNGLIDMPMMQKIAKDYMADLNRGENRFHQAADLLEQSHIKQHLRGDRCVKDEMFNLVDYMTTDPVLYKTYQNMPLAASVNRLNLLKEKELGAEQYKDALETTNFFEKTFRKLIEKYQFKRHNLAHGIKD